MLTCRIVVGILTAGPNSGGHLHPAFTISFALFKGFPWRKVPQYIVAQTMGAFLGGLIVYGQYRPQFTEMTEKLVAAGKEAMVYSSAGPSGALAIYMPHYSSMGFVFMNEIFTSAALGILVFQVLDPSNVFVTPPMVPIFIALGFFGAVACYAGNGIALNTARDLGARFAAACFWGTGVFPARMTAEATFTNILGTTIGAAIQTFWLSDSIRPPTEHAIQAHVAQEKEKEAHLNRILTARSSDRGGQGMLSRVLTGGKASSGGPTVDYSEKASA